MKVRLPCPYHNLHSDGRRGRFMSEIKNATKKQVIRFIYLHQYEGKFHHGYVAVLLGLTELVLVPCFVLTAYSYPG